MSDIIYLTGASGFIGQMIVKQIEADAAISKVYCPVRAKKGESGQDRFDGLFEGFSKAAFIDPSKTLPSDVTLVILNAYAVKFYNPVDEILKDNVEPMLKILDQCQVAGSRIRGISVVSTAYVQPPLPFKRDTLNRIDFVLADRTTPVQLYSELVSGTVTWPEALEKFGDLLSEHHKTNCYAFSKHIMESVIHEKYPSLPVCIVRPSIVAPSLCGTHGHGTRTGFPLFMEIARKPVLLFPRNEGKLNIVFVEEVARDIIRGASKLAAPATLSDKGAPFHPIYSATSSSDLASIELFQFGAPYIPRVDVRNNLLRRVLRHMEILAIRAVKGKRHSSLVQLMYENFDPIMMNNWDYEQTYAPTGYRVKECATQFYQAKLEEDKTSEKETKPSMISDSVVIMFLLLAGGALLLLDDGTLLSPVAQTVLLFVLFRLAALGTMQSLFYGDTLLRQSAQSTLYLKEHDKTQHEREELTWPSVLVSGLEMFVVFKLGLLPDPTTMKLGSARGLVIMLLTHAIPVELIYYWAHRIMHSNASLYSIHKYHHLSVVPTPKTSVSFLWSEHFFYDLLFALPVLVPAAFGEASLAITLFYVPVFDIVNALGHTNLELFPSWYIDSPMYPFFYCTTYHHVHHKYFKYNYALFMPIWDMIFGTYSPTLTEKDFFAAQKRRLNYGSDEL